MSVQSQIDRLNAIKARIRTNLIAQGVTVPADSTLDEMASQILSVAGEDYVLTEADKTEIAALVIEMLGGNPIFGVVDSNNHIVLNGDLPDGTYSVKYEMENGNTVNIGNLVLDSNVYYSVTNNLTNCTNSNSATQAIGGQSYSATITANSGYELSSVVVTMGGNAVTVTNGVINIANVTGNIVITAVAEVTKVEITNFADPSSSDWAAQSRISNSSTTGISAADSNLQHMHVTNYIPVQKDDIIVLGNCSTYSSTVPNARFAVYTGTTHSTRVYNGDYLTANDYMTRTSDNKFTVTNSDVKYVRFTIFNVTDANAVTIQIQRNGAYL